MAVNERVVVTNDGISTVCITKLYHLRETAKKELGVQGPGEAVRVQVCPPIIAFRCEQGNSNERWRLCRASLLPV